MHIDCKRLISVKLIILVTEQPGEQLINGFAELINVLPLLALSPLDTVQKNRYSDKRSSSIVDYLGRSFVKQRLNFV